MTIPGGGPPSGSSGLNGPDKGPNNPIPRNNLGPSQSEDNSSVSEEGLDIGLVVPSSSETVHSTAMSTLFNSNESLRFFVGGTRTEIGSSDTGFICQGDTTLLECRMQAVGLYQVSAQVIDTVYNSASTGWSSRNINPNDPRIILLRQGWNDFFGCNLNNSLCRLQFCAGDATYVVQAALRGYQFASRIIVVALSPSSFIDSSLCRMVRYYRSTTDFFSILRDLPEGEMRLVPRSPESRGTLDEGIQSSTFQALLEMEALCFHLRQELIIAERWTPEYDTDWDQLRDDFIYVSGCCLDPDRESRRRILLESFLHSHLGRCERASLHNFYEEAMDEYPRNYWESVLRNFDLIRDLSLLISAVIIVHLHGIPMRGAGVAVGSLEACNLIRRLGPYCIQRRMEGGNIWRMAALQGQILGLLSWLIEGGLGGYLIVNPEIPSSVSGSLGLYLGVRGVTVLVESLIEISPSLRGRLQRFLTRIETGDITQSEVSERQAQQLGLIQRVLRSSTQIAYGLGTMAVAASLIYPLICASEFQAPGLPEANSGNETVPYSRWQSSSPDGYSGLALLVITGSLSVGSMLGHILNIRQLERGLRNRFGGDQAQENERVLLERDPEDGHDTDNEAETGS